MQTLKLDFALIDISEFQRPMAQKGLQLIEHESRSLPAGKVLAWDIEAIASRVMDRLAELQLDSVPGTGDRCVWETLCSPRRGTLHRIARNDNLVRYL